MFGELLKLLLLTALYYSGPIAVYRYAIRKKPLDKKHSIITSAIYGLCAFALMSIIAYNAGDEGANSTAWIVWSMVNFFMLSKGKNIEEHTPAQNTSSLNTQEKTFSTTNNFHSNQSNLAPTSQKINFCRQCGAQIIEGSSFCNKCGSRLDWN